MAQNSNAFANRVNTLVDWMVERWLGIVVTVLLVFVFGPFLAPLLMALGWTRLGEVIHWIYIPFCHQLPQRSWFLFGEQLTYTLEEIQAVYPHVDHWNIRFFYGDPNMGWKVAWSDRMISFYTAVPLGGLVYAILGRFWGRPLPRLPVWLFVLLIFPIGLDVFTHFINDAIWGVSGGGFRDTNSWLAALTGGAFPGFYAGDHYGTFNWWVRLITGIPAGFALAFFLIPIVDRALGLSSKHKREEDTGLQARWQEQRTV